MLHARTGCTALQSNNNTRGSNSLANYNYTRLSTVHYIPCSHKAPPSPNICVPPPPSAIILELLPTLYSATFPINLWDKVPFRGKSSFTRWVSEHELSNWQGLLMQNVHQHSQHRQRGEANLQAEVTVSLIQKKEKGLVSSFFSRSAFRCSSFFCNYNKTNSILIL